MTANIPEPARSQIAPLLERWKSFLGKVEGRLGEVEAESEAGIEELLDINPADPGPISAGFSAVQARFSGLQQKVELAREKLESEWEEAVGDLDLEGPALQAVNHEWDLLRKQEDAFVQHLTLRREKLLTRKQADWARKLFGLAQGECARERACPQCGAAYRPEIQHAFSNMKCPFCGALNEVDPGSATGMYYQGGGVHHLALEQAFPQWEKMTAAERAYQRLRHPTEDDRKAFLQAAREYWLAYYRATQKLHPGFAQTVEEATGAKMLHFDSHDPGSEKKLRARRGEILALARAGDRAGIEAALKKDPRADLDDLVGAVFEHGETKGAALLLEMQHARESVDEPRAAWVQEKLAELAQDMARR